LKGNDLRIPKKKKKKTPGGTRKPAVVIPVRPWKAGKKKLVGGVPMLLGGKKGKSKLTDRSKTWGLKKKPRRKKKMGPGCKLLKGENEQRSLDDKSGKTRGRCMQKQAPHWGWGGGVSDKRQFGHVYGKKKRLKKGEGPSKKLRKK